MVLGDAVSRGGLTRMLERMDRQRFEAVWPPHEDGIRRYFVDPLAPRDIDELGRILGPLIRVNGAAIQLDGGPRSMA